MASSVRIYAGTQEGLFVWRSKNGAWENVAVSFETGTIDSVDGLRSRPNVVYLGVTQDGLYRTDDAGKSWRRVFEGNVRAVTVDLPMSASCTSASSPSISIGPKTGVRVGKSLLASKLYLPR